VITANERRATSPAQPVPDDQGAHRVAALSAALMQAVLNTYGENHEEFALRAGVSASVVGEAMDGTCPAWALPYDEFTALADVVAAMWPCAAFEIAAACDLLLSCVLNGDQFMATDVLAEPCSQDLAWALLRLVVTSESTLLPENVLALLSERAAALAASESPDAWVGAEILAGCLGRQS